MPNNTTPQSKPFSGKTALVTGAAGILGQHFCHALAAQGASIAAIDLDQAALDQLTEELTHEHGVASAGISCDITDPKAVDAMAGECVAQLGGIHILFNNAATKGRDLRAFFAPFEEYSLDVWREIMSVNIDGMFLVAQRVGKQMIQQQQGGSVVQTASIYGVLAPDSRIYEGSHYLGGPINTPAVYATSKAAVVGFSRYLAVHWAEHGIRVNCLVPGGVESGQNSEFTRRYSERIPMRRMAKAEEIVSAGLFLASDQAAYMTGQVVMVDGGLSAW